MYNVHISISIIGSCSLFIQRISKHCFNCVRILCMNIEYGEWANGRMAFMFMFVINSHEIKLHLMHWFLFSVLNFVQSDGLVFRCKRIHWSGRSKIILHTYHMDTCGELWSVSIVHVNYSLVKKTAAAAIEQHFNNEICKHENLNRAFDWFVQTS